MFKYFFYVTSFDSSFQQCFHIILFVSTPSRYSAFLSDVYVYLTYVVYYSIGLSCRASEKQDRKGNVAFQDQRGRRYIMFLLFVFRVKLNSKHQLLTYAGLARH